MKNYMKTIDLSKLPCLIEMDGPRLYVDVETYSIYAWNGDLEIPDGDQGFTSVWIAVNDLPEDTFIQYIESKISFYDILQNNVYSLATYNEYTDSLALINDLDYQIEHPGKKSFLHQFAKPLLPVEKQHFEFKSYFLIDLVTFGKDHFHLSIKYNHESASQISAEKVKQLLFEAAHNVAARNG